MALVSVARNMLSYFLLFSLPSQGGGVGNIAFRGGGCLDEILASSPCDKAAAAHRPLKLCTPHKGCQTPTSTLSDADLAVERHEDPCYLNGAPSREVDLSTPHGSLYPSLHLTLTLEPDYTLREKKITGLGLFRTFAC